MNYSTMQYVNPKTHHAFFRGVDRLLDRGVSWDDIVRELRNYLRSDVPEPTGLELANWTNWMVQRRHAPAWAITSWANRAADKRRAADAEVTALAAWAPPTLEQQVATAEELRGYVTVEVAPPEASTVPGGEPAEAEMDFADSTPKSDATILVFGGSQIRHRGEPGLEQLCLTDMWRAAGRPEGKRAPIWLRLDPTVEFVTHVRDTVRSAHDCADLSVTDAVAGRFGATWAHWQIAFAYAKHLSPAFHSWCNEAARARFESTFRAPPSALATVAPAPVQTATSTAVTTADVAPVFDRVLKALAAQESTTAALARAIGAQFAQRDARIDDIERRIVSLESRRRPTARLPKKPAGDLWFTVGEVARRYGASTSTVIAAMKRAGLEGRKDLARFRGRLGAAVHVSAMAALHAELVGGGEAVAAE